MKTKKEWVKVALESTEEETGAISLPVVLKLEIKGSMHFVEELKALAAKHGLLNKDESRVLSVCLESVCEKFNLTGIDVSVEHFCGLDNAVASCEQVIEQLKGLLKKEL